MCSGSVNTYPMSLNGDVRQVHKHVVQLTSAGSIFHCAEPAESQFIPANKDKTSGVANDL